MCTCTCTYRLNTGDGLEISLSCGCYLKTGCRQTTFKVCWGKLDFTSQGCERVN